MRRREKMKLQRKIITLLTIITIIIITALPASADLIFTKQISYSNTSLGIISGDGKCTSPLISNLGGDYGQKIYPFFDAEGRKRLALSLYNGGTYDTINIYNMDDENEWSNSSNYIPPVVECSGYVGNIHDYTSQNGYIYVIGYDDANIRRIKTTDYRVDQRYFGPSSSDGYVNHGEVLWSHSDKNTGKTFIYAIFSRSDMSCQNYKTNLLVKMNSQLEEVSVKPMEGSNINGFGRGAYAKKGDKVLVASLGGEQQFNGNFQENSSIELIDLSKNENDADYIKTVVTASEIHQIDPSFHHMISGVVYGEDKNVYVLCASWMNDEGQAGYNVRLYKTTEAKLIHGSIGTLIKTFDGDEGWGAGLTYDKNTQKLYVVCGTGIHCYNTLDECWKSYEQDDLKGSVADYSVLDYSSSDDDSEEENTSVEEAIKQRIEQINAIEINPLDLEGKTADSIAAAQRKLKELKKVAIEEIKNAKTTEEVKEAGNINMRDVTKLLKPIGENSTDASSEEGVGGGGCNTGSVALILLGLLPFIRRRK